MWESCAIYGVAWESEPVLGVVSAHGVQKMVVYVLRCLLVMQSSLQILLRPPCTIHDVSDEGMIK